MSFLFIGFCDYFLFYRTGKEIAERKGTSNKKDKNGLLLTAKKIAMWECSLFMRRGGLANGRGTSGVYSLI